MRPLSPRLKLATKQKKQLSGVGGRGGESAPAYATETLGTELHATSSSSDRPRTVHQRAVSSRKKKEKKLPIQIAKKVLEDSAQRKQEATLSLESGQENKHLAFAARVVHGIRLSGALPKSEAKALQCTASKTIKINSQCHLIVCEEYTIVCEALSPQRPGATVFPAPKL